MVSQRKIIRALAISQIHLMNFGHVTADGQTGVQTEADVQTGVLKIGRWKSGKHFSINVNWKCHTALEQKYLCLIVMAI